LFARFSYLDAELYKGKGELVTSVLLEPYTLLVLNEGWMEE
jgi:hypothetical protein